MSIYTLVISFQQHIMNFTSANSMATRKLSVNNQFCC